MLNTDKELKLYYSIGEVADMFGVNPSLLRFWEKEFPQISPKTAGRGIRQYRKEDVETIGLIYHLVKEKGMTLPGARQRLKDNKEATVRNYEIVNKLKAIKEELLAIKLDSGKTIENVLQEKILTIGENIKVRRFKRLDGAVGAYIHAGGKIGVLVKFDVSDSSVAAKDAFKSFSKDVAMQIAAVNPLYLDIQSVPSDVVEHEKKILKEQIVNDGKPENIAEKIVQGRIAKYFKEVCLVEQPFVKDGNMSIAQYVEKTAKELGVDIKISSFVRFEKGQGLEKKEDNFASEVAGMIK